MTAKDRARTRTPEGRGNGADAGGVGLPGWVLRCWPRTWRDTYGEEMTHTWCEAGGRRSQLLLLAMQGLRHRVVRPVAAGSTDLAAARPGQDVVVEAGPRYLLTGIVTALTAAAVCAVQVWLGWVLSSAERASQESVLSDGLLVAVLVGLPLVVAAWGERRTRQRRRRDQGRGLVLGAGLAVLLMFVLPAVVTGMTS